MYDLIANGEVDLVRYTQLLDIRRIIRDPLSGAIDGSNTIFQGNYSPALASGSTAIFSGTTPLSNYVFFPDNAQFELASAPALGSAQLYANYTYSSLLNETVVRMLFLGFDEMEARWSRGLRLTSSGSTYIAATEADSAIYIVGPSDVSDPTSCGIYFSTARRQIAFYMKCIQYVYWSQRLYEEAAGGMAYKEAGGMSVDTTKRAQNLKLLLDCLERDLEKLLLLAQIDWSQNASAIAIHSPQSADYQENFAWQNGVSTANRSTYNPYRGTEGPAL